MKRILMASASIVAFAGAAAAQDDADERIIFGGDAALGFNDNFNDEEETGFFYEADLNVTFRTTLDNGLVAESTFTIPIADESFGRDAQGNEDFVLGLSIDGQGALQIGDVAFGGEEFAFSNLESADFSEQDGETVLRGEGTIADFTVAASALILDENGDEPGERDFGDADNEQDFIDQLSIGANGTIGRFALSFGYQDESDIIGGEDDPLTNDINEGDSLVDRFDTTNGDFNPDEQYGISAGTAFAGATVLLGYGRNVSGDTDSYGVRVEYPIGPFSAFAEYGFEPDFDSDSYLVGATYNVGNIIVQAEAGEEVGEEEYDIKVGLALSEVTNLQAGYNDDDGGFVALRQGLGSGAFVEASYAEVEDAGFGNDLYSDDIREGSTLKVGLEF